MKVTQHSGRTTSSMPGLTRKSSQQRKFGDHRGDMEGGGGTVIDLPRAKKNQDCKIPHRLSHRPLKENGGEGERERERERRGEEGDFINLLFSTL